MHKNTNIKFQLKNHLIDFGLQFFDSNNEYHLWREKLFQNSSITINIKKRYLKYLNKNNLHKEYHLPISFYDLIASYKKLLILTHSMKSHDILYNGVSIIKDIKDYSNILDINKIQSSFYSKILPNSKVLGLDNSKKIIQRAKKIYNKGNYPNLSFYNNKHSLDSISLKYICDTQCLCTLKQKELSNLLDFLNRRLLNDGKIISISNLRDQKSTESFISHFYKKKFFIESLLPIYVQTLNGLVAYTKFIFTKKQNNNSYNIKLHFETLKNKISIVNLTNIF